MQIFGIVWRRGKAFSLTLGGWVVIHLVHLKRNIDLKQTENQVNTGIKT